MDRVKSLRNGSGAAATAARAGAAVWACRPAAGEESAAALEQQRAMAAIRAIFRVWGCVWAYVSQRRANCFACASRRLEGLNQREHRSKDACSRPFARLGSPSDTYIF